MYAYLRHDIGKMSESLVLDAGQKCDLLEAMQVGRKHEKMA